MSKLSGHIFEAGTLIHVRGVPFYLADRTRVLGTADNHLIATCGDSQYKPSENVFSRPERVVD